MGSLTKTPRSIDRFDRALGMRVRARRRRLGLSQSDLGKAVGLVFQQIQKYESGSNRISCSKLVELAHALECRPSDLIDDLTPEARSVATNQLALGASTNTEQTLLAAYAVLQKRQQKIVLSLAVEMAKLVYLQRGMELDLANLLPDRTPPGSR